MLTHWEEDSPPQQTEKLIRARKILRETVTYTDHFILFCEEQEPFPSPSHNAYTELSLKSEQVKSLSFWTGTTVALKGMLLS